MCKYCDCVGYDNDLKEFRNVIDWSYIKSTLNPDGAPGVNLKNLGYTNNADAVKMLEHELLVQARYLLCQYNKVPVDADADVLIEWLLSNVDDGVVCQVYDLFVKEEPHNPEKVAQGRFRLIWVANLANQIAERILWQDVSERQQFYWRQGPIMKGMGLDDLERPFIKRVIDELRGCGDAKSTDVSGWDWSVKLWLALLSADAMITAGYYPTHERRSWSFRRAALGQIAWVFVKYARFGDGKFELAAVGCVWPSGLYITTFLNSAMRVVLVLVVMWLSGEVISTNLAAMANGDDCVERQKLDANDLATWYKSLGFRVKEVRDVKGDMSFCSTHFPLDGYGRLESALKSIYRFASLRNTTGIDYAVITGLRFELRHSPELRSFNAMVYDMADGGVLDNESTHSLLVERWAQQNNKL